MANILFALPYLGGNKKRLPASDPSIERLKAEYWDCWRADEIESQSVANLLVDWLMQAGSLSIKKVQVILGVEPDGIVGEETLARLNSVNQLSLFRRIRSERMFELLDISATQPPRRAEMGKQLRRLAQFHFLKQKYWVG